MAIQEFSHILTSWLLTSGVKIICIFIGAYLANHISIAFLRKSVEKAVRVNPLLQNKKIDEKRIVTIVKVFSSTLTFVIWIAVFLMILPEFGINITPLLAGAGIIGLAVAMGSKDLVKDFLAGIFIILEGRYQVGDNVTIAGIGGTVKDISLRRTILEDSEGTEHFIPNGQIKITSIKK